MGLASIGHTDAEALGTGDPGEHRVQLPAGHTAHREHRGGLPHGAQVEAARGAGGGRADETGDGVDLDDALVIDGVGTGQSP